MFNDRKIICLCGSTKFKNAFETATREEGMKGNIVLTVVMFGHLEELDMDGEDRKKFDELHKDKIEMSDEILVLNVDGYIGESTRNELNHTIKLGKNIRYLEEIK